MKSCPVSVIIPTFNRASLLERAIRSVYKQTLLPYEVLVIDDGSTDETAEVLNTLSEKSLLPLKVIRTPNRGPAAARNRGIAAAECEFIAFLDSDDHWHKKKIELQYNALREQDSYFISHTMEKWLRRGEHLNQKKIHIPRHGEIFDHCLKLCAVGMSTVMARRNIFEHVGFFDENLRCCEDYDLWLRVSYRYPFLLLKNQLTVKEGGREDQVSFQFRLGMDELRIKSMEKILSLEPLDKQQFLATTEEIIRKLRIFGNGCIKHGKIDKGEHYLSMIDHCKSVALNRYPDWKSENG